MTDSEKLLVKRMLAGEERAFDEFFRELFPRLYRFVATRTGGDGDLAEDIVQAAMSKAVTRLDTWRGDGALFTWLCTFCRHELSAHFRKAGPRREVALDGASEVQGALTELARQAESPEMAAERDEQQRAIREILDAIPSKYADALEWKYVDGCSVQEIAARLGVSEKAAESVMTRARNAFRDAYEEQEHAEPSRGETRATDPARSIDRE